MAGTMTEEGEAMSCKEQDRKVLLQSATSNKPQINREATLRILKALTNDNLRPSNLFGNGTMIVSDISLHAYKHGVNMGIDEAGRGPVLGPMTYAAAFWAKETTVPPSGLNDSKQLTADIRETLFEQIMKCHEIGFVLRILSATEISRNMLRKGNPYNLNAMSHDAAMQMIQAVLDAGVTIHNCYVDTVGIPEAYQRTLNRVFDGRGINFVVEKKADAKYVECSAGSIIAKVARDRMIDNWNFSEPHYNAVGDDFGSGYPSDPKCKTWLHQNLADRIFGFPDFVRFSWGPAKTAVLEGGVAVAWEADDDDNDTKKQQAQMKAFISGEKKKKPRLEYFEKRKMARVIKLSET